jgi:hypothetical protein
MINFFLPIFYQIININSTNPCFLNKTAGFNMLQNCGFGVDYLKAIILPWEWITGGYFSLVLVTLLILATYIKYHKVLYPLLIGVIFLPISWLLFPTQFLIFGIVLAFVGVGIMIWFVFVKQSND